MRLIVIGILGLMVSATAGAETVTWTTENPAFDETIPVDFGATLVDVTGLEVRIAGDIGGRSYTCGDEGFRATHEIYFQVAGHMEYLRYAPDFEFDETFAAEPQDWNDLADGTTDISMYWLVVGDWFGCHAAGMFTVNPSVSSVTLILTCDDVVPNRQATWGGIKSLYR